VQLDAGYRLGLLVEDAVTLEIKSVETTSRLYEAQILTYISGFRRCGSRS